MAGVRFRIEPSGPLSGVLDAPGSKSHTNRALVAAALAEGDSVLRHPLDADDVRTMAAALGALGAGIESSPDALLVRGTAGRPGVVSGGAVTLDAGLSGTTMRFLSAVGSIATVPVVVTGDAPLLARPVGPLADALAALGAAVTTVGGRPPVSLLPSGISGGRVVVDASASSQFVSALLLVAPYASGDLEVVPENLGAAGYVALTVSLMRRWGADVSCEGGTVVVRAGAPYRARQELIAGDASSAAHLFALAAASGGEVRVTDLALSGEQPDLGVLAVLEEMGAAVRREADGAVVVQGPEELRPVEVDLSGMPDQLPTLAVLAALAPGRSVLHGAGVTRHHETDRLAAVATELGRVGVRTEVGPDSIVVHGGRPGGPAQIETYRDHRMAMAFAALGSAVELVVQEPGCVAKTYPRFWQDASSLGLAVRQED